MPDYSGESLEELDARLERGEGLLEAQPQPEEPVEEAPEPPAEQAPQQEAEADSPEQPAEQEPVEAATDEPGEQPEADPEFDLQKNEMEEMRLRLEQLRVDLERSQQLQSRDAGMVGHLKQLLERQKATGQVAPQPTQEGTEGLVDPYA
jgi:hypothetical protein